MALEALDFWGKMDFWIIFMWSFAKRKQSLRFNCPQDPQNQQLPLNPILRSLWTAIFRALWGEVQSWISAARSGDSTRYRTFYSDWLTRYSDWLTRYYNRANVPADEAIRSSVAEAMNGAESD